MQVPTKHPVLLLAALLGAAVLLLSLQHGTLRSGPAVAAGSGPEMELTVRDGGFCVANDCYAAVGETFQLSVDVITAPAQGYVMFQTYFLFGGVFDAAASEDGAGPGTCSDGIENGSPPDGRDYFDSDCTTVEIAYVPVDAPDLAEEITWDDAYPSLLFRGQYLHSTASHGAISGLFPPILESTFTGEVLSLQMICPATPAQATISLVLYGNLYFGTQGTVLVDFHGGKIIPKVNAITMNCVGTGDTDGDGCSDLTEYGPDPAQGGDRDFLNPWDFYDVAIAGGLPGKDGVVDLANDYMAVSSHFSPGGGPPYDVQYDRGAWGPGGSWNNTQGPDGVIDLPNDLMGVISQMGHSCA